MITATEFAERKARLDGLERDYNQAQGAHAELSKRLKEFKVSTLSELEDLAAITKKKAARAEAAYRKEEQKLLEEYDDQRTPT